jgi:uncharacterized protein
MLTKTLSLRLTLLTMSLALTGCQSVENAFVYPATAAHEPYQAPEPPAEDVWLTGGDGTRLHARWLPHPGATDAVLFCHGNGGNVETWNVVAKQIGAELGMSVLIFDYPGYGRSGSAPSEPGCYAAAEAAYRWLTETTKTSPERIILWGESLGGAVAVELASRQPHRALILVRTFTSLPEAADDQLPILVSSTFLTNRYESVGRIGKCRSPVFIAAAEKDRMIPLRHGQHLQAACTAPAELCVLRGLEHNDPLPRQFYAEVREFLIRKAPAP